jgi:hypothetical protein
MSVEEGFLRENPRVYPPAAVPIRRTARARASRQVGKSISRVRGQTDGGTGLRSFCKHDIPGKTFVVATRILRRREILRMQPQLLAVDPGSGEDGPFHSRGHRGETIADPLDRHEFPDLGSAQIVASPESGPSVDETDESAAAIVHATLDGEPFSDMLERHPGPLDLFLKTLGQLTQPSHGLQLELPVIGILRT